MYQKRLRTGVGSVAVIALQLVGCGQIEPDDWWRGTGLPAPVPEPLTLLQPLSPKGPNPVPKLMFAQGRWLASRSGNSLDFQETPQGAGPGAFDALPSLWSRQTLGEVALRGGVTLVTDQLLYRGIPVRGATFRHAEGLNGMEWLSGSVPSAVWEESEGSQAMPAGFLLGGSAAMHQASIRLGLPVQAFSEGTEVYVVAGKELLPAYVFRIDGAAAGIPLEAVVAADTGTLLEVKSLALSIDGHARMYRENKVTDQGVLSDVTLPALAGDGAKLDAGIFRVLNCRQQEPQPSAGNCVAYATSTSGDFTSITPDDERYDELVSFHAVSWALEWNRRIMALPGIAAADRRDSWGATRSDLGLTTARPIVIYTRSLARSSTGTPTYDNAQYLPAGMTGTGGPMIVIGTGWEVGQSGPERMLRYLGKDADVILHEFHHHVNFRTLTDVDGETGAIHEGLADYFAYAITGNNKLGESIVPATATLGALRAGNLQGKIQTYARAPLHEAGRFFSSSLWDVRTALGPWKDGFAKADKIVVDAVDLAAGSETYYGFIAAMGRAADAFAAANGESPAALKKAMFQVFADRGFVATPDDSGNLPAPGSMISQEISSGSAAVPTASGSSGSGKSSSKKGWCGVVGQEGERSFASSLGLILAIALLPLLALIRRPQRIPVRARRQEVRRR